MASGGNTVATGLFESVAAGLADRWPAAVVLVVGGDVADALVEAHGVVVLAHPSWMFIAFAISSFVTKPSSTRQSPRRFFDVFCFSIAS